jgi:LacI family transcriptional regulator, galactose operon repressor
MKSRPISQQRIARELGISQGLVSRVLNGKRENISKKTYERIWKYALDEGYRPKGMQANANHGAAPNVGFILRAGLRLYSRSNYFNHIEHGLHQALLDRGYCSFYFGAEDELPVQDLSAKFKPFSLFGIAILGEVKLDFLKAIKAAQKNVVSISEAYPGLCHSVVPNERQSIQLLVEHLMGLGHTQFAWIGGNKRLHHNNRRRQALLEALELNSLVLSPKYVVELEGGDRLDGWKAAEILLQRISPRVFPTACVCLNALMARGLINCLMQKGWRVPEQISVVAVDASRVCEEEHPQITGAHSDAEQMGRTAAELLLRATDPADQTLVDVMLPAQLTVRETSGQVNSVAS